MPMFTSSKLKNEAMKQQGTTSTKNGFQSTTPSRLRASSKAEESPKPEAVNGASSSSSLISRTKSVAPDVKREKSKAVRSLALNKPKPAEDVVGSRKGREGNEARVAGRLRNLPVVEQFSRPRRQRPSESNSVTTADDLKEKTSELQEELHSSENLIKDLKSQVLALKAELDKSQSLNLELQWQNKKLSEDLAAAEAKIAALAIDNSQGDSDGGLQNPKFNTVRTLIGNKLEQKIVRKETIDEAGKVKIPKPPPLFPVVKATDQEYKFPSSTSLPPPPPPPLPPLRSPGVVSASQPQQASQIAELFHSFKNKAARKDSPSSTNSAHNSIVGEIQNRSAHLLAIKADIETKGEFINGLIQKVLKAAYTDIEDVLKFVDWLDGELSSLADERAVLKHFNWPERKADAMREAAIEYRALKLLECEISSYEDDTALLCGAALKKMANLLDKSERSIQRLTELRNAAMRSYQDCKIPTDWMLDSGIVSKIKQASMNLAKIYMKRIKTELEFIRSSENQESLLLQGLHFAYRTQQFAGCLDSETLCAFEEIRQHVPGQLGRSEGLLVGIQSS